jgi:DNA-binding FadR family transcriptional regulator
MSNSSVDGVFDVPALRPQDWDRRRAEGVRGGPRLSRGEEAAAQLIAIAGNASPGDRLGSKEELRARCEVSVGTFNEAVRIAQSRCVVTVRPGPGGGVFAAVQSPMVRLGNSVLALDSDATSVAEAVRIRDALDPLLMADALFHASPADIAELRAILADMAAAVAAEDPLRFLRANWSLHKRIADLSPQAMLRSLYVSLLELIESHTLQVRPAPGQAIPPGMAKRHDLHVALVDALEARDRERALQLIADHNSGERPSAGPLGAAAAAAEALAGTGTR